MLQWLCAQRLARWLLLHPALSCCCRCLHAAAQVECEVLSADVERIGVDVLSSELQVGWHW